jgi:hypothetical protein
LTGAIRTDLAPFYNALTAAERPDSARAWLTPKVRALHPRTTTDVE